MSAFQVPPAPKYPFDAAGNPYLPPVLRSVFSFQEGSLQLPGADSAAAAKKLLPNLQPQCRLKAIPSAPLVSVGRDTLGRRLTVGIAICGGPAPGIISLLSGVYHYLKQWNGASRVMAFCDGLNGILKRDFVEIDNDVLDTMVGGKGLSVIGAGRHPPLSKIADTVISTLRELNVDGLILVGGHETCTDAAVLASMIKATAPAGPAGADGKPTVTKDGGIAVVAVPKRAEAPRTLGGSVSFGFDTLSKIYANLVSNLCIDGASARSSYHFVRLMGEAASQLVLETALQAHPNFALIGEECYEKGWGVSDVVNQIADVVAARAAEGKQYGCVVIPEGIVYFIKELHTLIRSLTTAIETARKKEYDSAAQLQAAVCAQLHDIDAAASALFKTFPQWLQTQVIVERNTDGTVKLSQVQFERFLAEMVQTELEGRKKKGTYVGKFAFNCHFFGYEARSCTPSAFDVTLAYTYGRLSAKLIEQRITAAMPTVKGLSRAASEWECGAVPLAALIQLDQDGKVAVARHAVQLDSYAFRAFAGLRALWGPADMYRRPAGEVSAERNATLLLEDLQIDHKERRVLDSVGAQELHEVVQAISVDESEFIRRRKAWEPDVPRTLLGGFSLKESDPSPFPSAEDEAALKERFKGLFEKSMHCLEVVPHVGTGALTGFGRPLSVAVLFSGGPAPGGHNIVAGLFSYLRAHCTGSRLFGILDGPDGVVKWRFRELTEVDIESSRNLGGFDLIGTSRTKIETEEQFDRAAHLARELHLDGLVICGGDDSATNAALLAEAFLTRGLTTRVVAVPKTIDADLRRLPDLDMSFGFDTTVKLYSRLTANIAADAAATKGTWHFVRLMGRSASHITVEVALQVKPQYIAVAEEVEAKGQTMRQLSDELVEIVIARRAAGRDYGVVVIPEGLVEFTSDMKGLIAELNELLAGKDVPTLPGTGGPDLVAVGNMLSENATTSWKYIPEWLQVQLLGERDPHGNVRVAQIQSERLVAALVEKGLQARDAHAPVFNYRTTYLGYQGRCGLVSNFDCSYTYTCGHIAAALIENGVTGHLATVRNLTASPDEWRCGSLPLVSLMNTERRKGAHKPVIKKMLVDLEGAPFKALQAQRAQWAKEDCYPSRQEVEKFLQPTSAALSMTMLLEQGSPITATRSYVRCVPATLGMTVYE